MSIHPTAIVDSQARIAQDVSIGAFTIIEGPVEIGAGTRVGSCCHLSGDTIIGENNEIHMGCVIGHTPQHLGYKGGSSGVRIGSGNVFREYVSIHRAYVTGTHTVIGDNNYIMGYCHVAHDCRLGNGIIMANQCLLAGHVTVGDNSNLSGHVGVHQFVRIGRLAMVGGMSKVTKDLPPFMMVGEGEGVHGLNVVGLRRAGLDAGVRRRLNQAFRLLYRSGLNVPQAVEAIEADADLKDQLEVRELVEFIRGSARGILRGARGRTRGEGGAEGA
jgi:UDP-N-acetylglucosamine acyltransferase